MPCNQGKLIRGNHKLLLCKVEIFHKISQTKVTIEVPKGDTYLPKGKEDYPGREAIVSVGNLAVVLEAPKH